MMTKEEILELDPRFQQLVNLVLHYNETGFYSSWAQLWMRMIKPMNQAKEICGFGARVPKLRNNRAYESMVYILENMCTLNM